MRPNLFCRDSELHDSLMLKMPQNLTTYLFFNEILLFYCNKIELVYCLFAMNKISNKLPSVIITIILEIMSY